MPKGVTMIPPVRAAAGTEPNPVSRAVAEAVNDLHGVAVVKELRRAMVDPPAPAPSPAGEQIAQVATAISNLTNSAVATSKSLVDSYEGQAHSALETAKFEAARRREAEEAAEKRAEAARVEEREKGELVLKIMAENSQQLQKYLVEMAEARTQSGIAEVKAEVGRLMERLDYEARVHQMERDRLQEKIEEQEHYIRNRPPSFEEQLFRAMIGRYGDGDLAKALPFLFGDGAKMTPQERLANAQATWYERELENDSKRKLLEAEGNKAMKEQFGQAGKEVAGLVKDFAGKLLGLPGSGGSSFLPDDAPPPRAEAEALSDAG